MGHFYKLITKQDPFLNYLRRGSVFTCIPLLALAIQGSPAIGIGNTGKLPLALAHAADVEGVSPLALAKHVKIGFSQQLWRNSCWFQRCRCAGEGILGAAHRGYRQHGWLNQCALPLNSKTWWCLHTLKSFSSSILHVSKFIQKLSI